MLLYQLDKDTYHLLGEPHVNLTRVGAADGCFAAEIGKFFFFAPHPYTAHSNVKCTLAEQALIISWEQEVVGSRSQHFQKVTIQFSIRMVAMEI